MFNIFRPRFLLIGMLILLWLWVRRREAGQVTPATKEPLEFEVPSNALTDYTPPKDDTAERVDDSEPEIGDRMGVKPETEPEKAEPDDLRRIEGIGPKISNVLQEAGITTYTQLASMSAAQIREVLNSGGIRIAQPDTWPEQAKLAADGNWDKLETLKGEFKVGRRV